MNQLQLNIDHLNPVVEDIIAFTNNTSSEDIEEIQRLYDLLMTRDANIMPWITAMTATVANMFLIIRQPKAELGNCLQELFKLLNPAESQAIQSLRITATVRMLLESSTRSLQAARNILRRNDLTEEDRAQQIQTIATFREMIAAAEQQLRLAQPLEQQR